MSELKELLINVKDSYNDFVLAMLDEAGKSENRRDELIRYLKNNKEALSSDVIRFVMTDLGLYNEYRSTVCTEVLAS